MNRSTETDGGDRLTHRTGVGTEDWHVQTGSSIGRRLQGSVPVWSSPVSLIRFSSLPGLVEEDVSRLWVLGDVWGKPVKLLDCLGVDFLHKTVKTNVQVTAGTLRLGWVREQRAEQHRLSVRVTHLHYIIIKQQPEAMTLHDGDVMSSVRTTENTETNSDSAEVRHCVTPVWASCNVVNVECSL